MESRLHFGRHFPVVMVAISPLMCYAPTTAPDVRGEVNLGNSHAFARLKS